MTETLWIVLILAAVVIVILVIFRKQLSRFIFRIGREGLDTELETHPPARNPREQPEVPVAGSSPARGVSISRNWVWGRRNRISVRHSSAEVEGNRIIGVDQDLTVSISDPRVTHIYQQITNNFSLNDFRTLCLSLRIDPDTLSGNDLPSRTDALLTLLHDPDRLDELITQGRHIRPTLDWGE